MSNQNRTQRKKNNTKMRIYDLRARKILTIGTILLIIIIFSTIFALLNSLKTTMLYKMKINGTDISNLEVTEAYKKLAEEFENRKSQNIVLKYLEYETTISLSQIEVTYNIDEAIKLAYSKGRDRNILKSNYEIIYIWLIGNDIKQKIDINFEQLDKIIEDITVKIPGIAKESSYYIENENLIILSGKEGVEVDKKELKARILKNIEQQIYTGTMEIIDIPIKQVKPKEINIEEIYKEIYKEPKNAYYETEPFRLYTQVNGVDLKISIEEIKEMLKEKKEEYSIPLKITIPEITTQSLGNKAFPEVIGKYSTRYDESNKNRTNNIKLASDKIDETVLMPGETFSYNKIVGERTIKAGYKEAAVYMNGQVVDGIGGRYMSSFFYTL
ncbi:MAG: hypothetical protein HFJ53_04395 [Clostridia bacterium]|jgi:vancomycin resistance protein YoaR|nr:hypothetical protein [Clostridia bacterium]